MRESTLGDTHIDIYIYDRNSENQRSPRETARGGADMYLQKIFNPEIIG